MGTPVTRAPHTVRVSCNFLGGSLPSHTRWDFKNTWVAFDFTMLRSGVRPLVEAAAMSEVPAEWRRLHCFGEEIFDDGGAFLCVDEGDGSIHRFDGELDEPDSLLNSAALQF